MSAPKIPNEIVMEKAEELQRLLEEQLGKPIHGIVVSLLVEHEKIEDGMVICPVSMGRWKRDVADAVLFSRWTACFAEYLFTRLLNNERKGEPRNEE